MTDRTSRRHAAARKGITITAGALTMLVIVAVFCAMTAMRPLPGLVDASHGTNAGDTQTVSQLQLESYCPARMTLADTGSYGDSAFQVTAGDIASTSRYAAFGSVYRSVAGSLTQESGTTLKTSDAADGIAVASGDVDDAPALLRTRLLDSASGTGAAAAVASVATDGDLRGVSAASCITPALSHGFLLSGTQTGTTQQLVVANPSNKATTVRVRAWGTTGTTAITLSIGENVTVKAGGETVVDLSAAAAGQDGLYVSVDSRQTPVAAVVRTVVMDGLTPLGSDYVVSSGEANRTAVMPGIAGGDAVRVLLFSRTDTNVVLSWVGDHGRQRATTAELTAGKVAVVDLKKAPKTALAVRADADGDAAIYAAAQATVSANDGQSDFASINAATAAGKASAIAVPDGTQARLVLANTGDGDQSGTLTGYDDAGNPVGSKRITVSDGTAVDIDAADIADDAVVWRWDGDGTAIAWGARLTAPAVDKAKQAGLAYLTPNALEPLKTRIWVSQNPSIVR
ncbi:hypothetical protein DSM100688_1579 [Bifidobacterium ramosum]|uniref:Organic solvents resistance ABC transporter permease n=1 Tax=Bifidobacterium ramosum TaxID=1798158 RepID=A0A6L4WZE0_9BIFI|nr:DUF5719 family protein [Bifidobacterium ramosum]KAB8287492.1 hypothetical protein DSM100688_1579 [Bifidobacterium ramosum]NEG72212.1 hypothetical protein [Bifidobacterium ramosum]